MRSTGSSIFSKPATFPAAVIAGCVCAASASAADTWEDTTVYGRFQTFTTQDGLPDNRIRAIRVVGDQVWVGTEGGLALRDVDKWRSWTREEGMPADAINAIDVDPRTRDVWLGTWGHGLVRLSAGRFDLFDQMNSGLAGDLVFDVIVRGSRVWAATNAGVSVYDTQSDTWDLYNARRADRTGPAITALILDRENLFGGAWRGFPRRFDRRLNDWVSISGAIEKSGITVNLAAHDQITTGAIAADGSALWWVAGSTLLRHDSRGRWTQHETPPFSAPVESMTAFSSAGGEQAWISTGDGLYVLADRDTDTWVVYKACGRGTAGTAAIQRGERILGTRAVDPAIPDNRFRCVAFQGENVWIGTANGLALGTGKTHWSRLHEASTVGQEDSGALCPPKLSRTSDLAASGPDARESKPPAIAVFGPRSRTIALAGGEARGERRRGWTDLLGVQLATEEYNARGGYRGGGAFEIVTTSVGYSRYGWGTEEDDLVSFASYDNVQGIVGFLGAGDHVRDAVVFRTQVPFLNVGEAFPSIETVVGRNPWVFRCYGGEPRQHRMLLDYLFDRLGRGRVAVLRTTSRIGERHLDWWSDCAAARGLPVVADLRFDGASATPATLESLRRSRPDVVLTWCDMSASAALLRSMRAAGMKQLFVGGKEIVGDDFAALVGIAPGPVIAMYPTRPLRKGRAVSAFSRKYSARNVIGSVPTPPGLEAYRSYEATDHLLDAINAAGPSREAVRQVLSQMARSASGEEHYESRHGRDKAVIARLEAGKWKFKMIP